MTSDENTRDSSSLELQDMNIHGEPEKFELPKAIGFILSFKFFERFCIQSIKTLLVLYLTSQLGYSAHSATIVYHSHSTVIFLMGIFGAIVADSWLGKFQTILYMHIVGTAGMVFFVLTTVSQIHMPFRSELTVITLLILSVGNGCVKPCLTALGSDQFQGTDHSDQIQRFFSKFYFVLKLSSVGASFTAPILRSDIPSISAADSYLLAFGINLGMYVIALAIFLAGIPHYVKLPVTDNMLVRVTKCIGVGNLINIFRSFLQTFNLQTGIKGKWNASKPEQKRAHWLDHALDTHSPTIVQDAKILLNILVMLTPLPMFWALNEQTASMIPLQAARMNGDLGFYTVKPDQLQLMMNLMVMGLIPFCDVVLYPLLARVGIVSVFQRIAFGGFVSMVAFILAGILETQIESSANPLPLIWIVPQYVLLALVEAVVGVLSMVFANLTAPKSLKTVIQASFLATHGMGNLYDVTIISIFSFFKQAHLFFLFSGLMFLNTMFFIVLAMRYKTLDEKKT